MGGETLIIQKALCSMGACMPYKAGDNTINKQLHTYTHYHNTTYGG